MAHGFREQNVLANASVCYYRFDEGFQWLNEIFVHSIVFFLTSASWE